MIAVGNDFCSAFARGETDASGNCAGSCKDWARAAFDDDRANGNRLNLACLDALMNACAEAAVDPEVRVIVLTGAGSMFCLGDVPEMSGLPERFAHRVALTALRNLMKSTVA